MSDEEVSDSVQARCRHKASVKGTHKVLSLTGAQLQAGTRPKNPEPPLIEGTNMTASTQAAPATVKAERPHYDTSLVARILPPGMTLRDHLFNSLPEDGATAYATACTVFGPDIMSGPHRGNAINTCAVTLSGMAKARNRSVKTKAVPPSLNSGCRIKYVPFKSAVAEATRKAVKPKKAKKVEIKPSAGLEAAATVSTPATMSAEPVQSVKTRRKASLSQGVRFIQPAKAAKDTPAESKAHSGAVIVTQGLSLPVTVAKAIYEDLAGIFAK